MAQKSESSSLSYDQSVITKPSKEKEKRRRICFVQDIFINSICDFTCGLFLSVHVHFFCKDVIQITLVISFSNRDRLSCSLDSPGGSF